MMYRVGWAYTVCLEMQFCGGEILTQRRERDRGRWLGWKGDLEIGGDAGGRMEVARLLGSCRYW
jgi:hypothetical protein